jgi:hypothetical protein
MRDYQGYIAVNHGEIPESKLRKVIKGGKLTFTKEELAGNTYKTLFHPQTSKMLKIAQRKGTGANSVPVAIGEIMADMNYHNNSGSSMRGGSIWKTVWSGLKSLWNPVIKPALSTVADMAVAPIQSALTSSKFGAPLAAFVPDARAKLKELTGVGMTTQQKRLIALEKARASKQNKKINILTGSSFKIN